MPICIIIAIFFSTISSKLYTQESHAHTPFVGTGSSSADLTNYISNSHSLTTHMSQHDDHQSHDKTMHSMYGRYTMRRDSSGTSWVPDSSPAEGFMINYRNWLFMVGGFSYLVFDHQTGKRGNKKFFDENMLMATAQRDFGNSTFAFRTMFSLEPITIGKCGYPLLLQTGETCNGITPLIDRQHPHDLFMELALVGTYHINDKTSTYLYLGLPGEPALGPPIYIMRFSSEYIPEAPLGHHWMDSTHVTFGVITAGFVYNTIKFEASVFNGREPDEHRFDIEKPRLNSYSYRISFNPTENLALQASYAFIKSPEKMRPELNINRTTLSVIYNKPFGSDNNLQASAIVGINHENTGHTLPAFLLEATLELKKRHVCFGRFEAVKKEELFIEPDPLADQFFNVKKITFGYVYEFAYTHHSKWGIGALCGIPLLPKTLSPYYGNAFGYMIFLQVKLI